MGTSAMEMNGIDKLMMLRYGRKTTEMGKGSFTHSYEGIPGTSRDCIGDLITIKTTSRKNTEVKQ